MALLYGSKLVRACGRACPFSRRPVRVRMSAGALSGSTAVGFYLLAGAGLASFWGRSPLPVAPAPSPPETTTGPSTAPLVEARDELAQRLFCAPAAACAPCPEAEVCAPEPPSPRWTAVLAGGLGLFLAGLCLGGILAGCCCSGAFLWWKSGVDHGRSRSTRELPVVGPGPRLALAGRGFHW